MANKLSKAIEAFILRVESNDKSERTVSGYKEDLNKLLEFTIDNKITLSEIDSVILDEFKTYLNNATYIFGGKPKKYANSTKNRVITTVRAFFRYMTQMKKVSENPAMYLENLKREKHVAKHLNLQQAKKLLGSVEGSAKERDRAMITIFLYCGLRVGELVKIQLKEIDLEYGSLTVPTINSKNKQERVLMLNSECVDVIKNYLKLRKRHDKDDFLFLNYMGNGLTTRGVQKILDKYFKQIGVEGATPHSLRHTSATLAYSVNKDLKEVQHLLGHTDIATTANIYTHIVDSDMQDLMDNHPLRNI